MDDMTFMAALEIAMKHKWRLGRRCWGEILIGIENEYIPFVANPDYEKENARRLSWNPTPDDLLASDWYVVMG